MSIQRIVLAGLLVFACLGTEASTASADARTDYLVRTLTTSDSFRVRVEAALSLGRLRPASGDARRALEDALKDEHPAVRTAAAASLGAIEDPDALPALRAARRDSSADVRRAVDGSIMALQRVAAARRDTAPSAATPSAATPSAPAGPARYYIGIGNPAAGDGVDAQLADHAREVLERELGRVDGVEVAPSRESNAAANRVLRQRRLDGFAVDSRIVAVERVGSGTRVRVSVILGTYPGRDMRAIMQGAATASGPASAATERRALDAAIQGALRQLSQALQASTRSARR